MSVSLIMMLLMMLYAVVDLDDQVSQMSFIELLMEQVILKNILTYVILT